MMKMTNYLKEIADIAEKITDIAELTTEFYSQESALASISEIDKLADELKKTAKEALEPPF